ncbi:Dipeptidyl aminopeptidase-like protein 6 [Liparis tanakae]|uniref:Dipeptidyl aminopeptidase-like protein 6 n=1 Tax=Liparis tanakae TaxID=230148 RepID=A0A4Z2FWC0_9TELE|nr:Dipeptidyl aminopeptidase-like protein 6 [Liparis tanakae]
MHGSARCEAQLRINLFLVHLAQIYPDEGHFLHGDGTRQHLSQSLVNFFEVCFRAPEVVEEEEPEEDEDNG